ncbi:GNAT family N-acetyltransferase [Paenibacillus sp. PR3]|uniref:GNAT family N-acetyltransferase n=1 Tax=Paenibacillus terricola TaxID=2763503 RepID=A0ABR8N1T3_9BACL|nr:GNAT family N-acetyltransferase [Paenibacillus terricola]MBD3922134.1 GNAT family N-acetyltransferase [Paenibacillus terricola]
MELIVRRAEASDYMTLSRLSESWESENITYGLKANAIEDLESAEIWVADEEGLIAGYLLGEVRNNKGLAVFEETDEAYFEIEEIYVHPAHRSKGYGSALIQHVTELMNQRGITRMTVSTANKNWQKVMAFYQKHGFNSWTMTLYK